MYLEEHRQPWRNQSNKEELNHTAQEQAWRRLCSLGGAWGAPPGTMRNKNRHFHRTPSWTTWGKDQDPCFLSKLKTFTERIQEKTNTLLFQPKDEGMVFIDGIRIEQTMKKAGNAVC